MKCAWPRCQCPERDRCRDKPGPIPLYPDEATIAVYVVGPKRAKEWPGIAAALERQGFPQVNPLFGGRYWPAVVKWMDQFNGVAESQSAPRTDGVEDMGSWKSQKRRA